MLNSGGPSPEDPREFDRDGDGVLAASGRPDARRRYVDVLMASAIFPPVRPGYAAIAPDERVDAQGFTPAQTPESIRLSKGVGLTAARYSSVARRAPWK